MMKTRREFLVLATSAACAGCGGMGSSGAAWTRREIDALNRYTSRHGGHGWAAWQGRRQVAEWNSRVRGPALSITKVIAALAASRAATEGWLTPEEAVANTIPEWRGDPRKSRITVAMLLQQVSGLESGVIRLYRNSPPNKGAVAVTLRCVNAPGSVFRYGPSHWELLAELMRRKLAKQQISLAKFMQRQIMAPIGLSNHDWRSDKNGVPYFSTGTRLSVIEMGHLGHTISTLLRGKSSIGIKAEHFEAMIRPSTSNPMFGGGLWNNRNARKPGATAIEVERSIDQPLSSSFWNRACLSTSQPADLIASIGSGGRRIFIWPNEGKRVVRHGSSRAWRDAEFLGQLQ